jgi:hypothetical protein
LPTFSFFPYPPLSLHHLYPFSILSFLPSFEPPPPVDALHITPPTSSSPSRSSKRPENISIDGERLDASFGPFTVEVHKALGRTCALRGRWEGGDEFVELDSSRRDDRNEL